MALLLLVAGSACDAGDLASPGPSTTTLASAGIDTAVPTAPPATEAPTPTTEDDGPPVVLRGSGLGAHRFGDDVDEVLAGLTLRWGPPNQDSNWVPAATSPFGACPGEEVRGVEWTGFQVLFSGGSTPFAPAGRRHFFTWVYRAPEPGGHRPRLHTDAGISVGATVAELQGAYGDRLELFDDPEGGGPRFGITTPDGLLNGAVTSKDPAGTVTSIVGGGGCES